MLNLKLIRAKNMDPSEISGGKIYRFLSSEFPTGQTHIQERKCKFPTGQTNFGAGKNELPTAQTHIQGSKCECPTRQTTNDG